MGLYVNTNIAAMNAYQNLSKTNDALNQSLQRLSSGYRINTAADDAAGLAISEGLQSQIGGLTQAVQNTQDATSVVQTAEGALNETTSILQRMRDLSVQASNSGSLNSTATASIQKEIVQLKAEIDRISNTTTFNGTNLLDGSYTGTFQVGADSGQTISVAIGSAGKGMDSAGLGVSGVDVSTVAANAMSAATNNPLYPTGGPTAGTVTTTTASDAFSTNPTGSGDSWAKLDGTLSYGGKTLDLSTLRDTTVGDTAAQALQKLQNGLDSTFGAGAIKVTLSGAHLLFTGSTTAGSPGAGPAFTAAASGNITASTSPATTGAGTVTTSGLDFTTTGTGWSQLNGTLSYGGNSLDLATVKSSTGGTPTMSDLQTALNNTFGAGAVTVGLGGTGGKNLVFTGVTPGASDSSATLAAESPTFTQASGASAAITAIDNAINTVSSVRADLGAKENRFQHTINNLNTTIQNTTASQARIKDTDMASEMTKFTQNQVLVQAGTAMLAQANQSTQSILKLLQG